MEVNMWRKMTNLRRRRGSAVLDAALVFPILLSLTFGTVEYGYYFYVKHSYQGAAREGARVAITPSATNTEVTTAITNALTAAGLQSSGYTVTVSPSNVSGLSAGTSVSVTVTSAWGTAGSGFRPLGLIGSSKQVRGVTVMRKEG
ncbi:MAG: TadE/TadG family type IV pilus assembly protein [Tepidisphaeraceae bacterium]